MIQRCQNRCHMELVEKVTFAQLIVYQHSIQKGPLCVCVCVCVCECVCVYVSVVVCVCLCLWVLPPG